MRGPWQRGKARAALSPPWVLSWLWMANGKWNQSWRLLRNGCRAVSLGMLYSIQELRFVELCLHSQFVKAAQNLRCIHVQTHFKFKLEVQALFFLLCIENMVPIDNKHLRQLRQFSSDAVWWSNFAGGLVCRFAVCVCYYGFVFFSLFTSV